MRASHTAERPWITIREVSELLGVSPATVRRWADTGALPALVTPGGHRRFDRTQILARAGDLGGPSPRLHDLGETPERVVAGYRREFLGAHPSRDHLPELDAEQLEAFRAPGRRILRAILAHLDTDAGDLSEGIEAAASYGHLARDHGLSAEDLTQTFLAYRLAFLDRIGETAREHRLPRDEATSLVLHAARCFDRLLVAAVAAHERPG